MEEVAEKYSIDVVLLCDMNHILTSDYSEVIVVGAGADAVDYKLISICHKGDIVVSQDYGVAAMALGKGVYVIHQSGKWYTNENIDQMLMERHLNKKARRGSHKNHLKDPKKRTEEDDERFAQSFEKLVLEARTRKETTTMDNEKILKFKSYGNFYKSIIDQDRCAVVICNLEHEIIYMNPAAVLYYGKRGGEKLIGRSLMKCHNQESGEKIQQVVDWFREDDSHNIVYTFHNEKQNKDVYMVALREKGKLIGYYEKHEYRNKEEMKFYDLW